MFAGEAERHLADHPEVVAKTEQGQITKTAEVDICQDTKNMLAEEGDQLTKDHPMKDFKVVTLRRQNKDKDNIEPYSIEHNGDDERNTLYVYNLILYNYTFSRYKMPYSQFAKQVLVKNSCQDALKLTQNKLALTKQKLNRANRQLASLRMAYDSAVTQLIQANHTIDTLRDM